MLTFEQTHQPSYPFVLQDILITSWNQGILVEVEDGEQRIAASLPAWDNIVFAAFTHNELTSLDSTIVSMHL